MLSTIGYEGASLDDFVATLKLAEVNTLIDIRDRAQSRRPGFSKTALRVRLESEGISYLHLKQLGDPKEGRDAARSGQMDKFRKIYGSVLETEGALSAIDQILNLTESSSACLLCYERNPHDCHRMLVSDLIERKHGLKARHLGVRTCEPLQHQRR